MVVPVEPVPAAAVPPAVAPLPDVFRDIVAMAAPDWAVGVEVADIINNTKTKCFLCGLGIMKGEVLFRYWQSESVQKYMHSTCAAQVPANRSLHSQACLRYQVDFSLGHHGESVKIKEAIELALPFFP